MDELAEHRSRYQSFLVDTWRAAIASAFGTSPPPSKSWTLSSQMAEVLLPFMTANYCFLPPNGHLPFIGVRSDGPLGILRFDLSEDSECEVMPRRLDFEYFPESPEQSFFLLELRPMRPTGVYEEVGIVEQVLWAEGEYHDYGRSHGVWGHDSKGEELPFPDDTKGVLRLRGGKVLIVCQGSLWNHENSTWDGRHNNMTPAQIRASIEKMLGRA